MRGGVNVVGGEEVGDPAPFTLLLGFYGLSRNLSRPLVRMLWECICVKIYQEDPEFWPLLVISGSVVHQIECSSVITAGLTIRGERS